jgi:hypothetical protein
LAFIATSFPATAHLIKRLLDTGALIVSYALEMLHRLSDTGHKFIPRGGFRLGLAAE